jgi:hypothetical protein
MGICLQEKTNQVVFFFVEFIFIYFLNFYNLKKKEFIQIFFKLNQDHRLLSFFFRNVTSSNHYIIN